jgi:cell wall-associated NlpC family hydrolase
LAERRLSKRRFVLLKVDASEMRERALYFRSIRDKTNQMKTPAAALVVLSCFPIAGPSWAIQRKHHPWFSSSSPRTKDTGSRLTIRRDDVNETDGRGGQVVKQALRYKGTHYKFGGTSKRGLDCSGLVSRVWSDLKMKKIPRVSSALYHSGKPVTMAELRPGDLVFFKNTYKPGISHVGVYAGNNKFVHAANRHKGVTIARLSDPYYQLHYAGARRLY